MILVVAEKHIYDETTLTVSCEGSLFTAKGKTVVQDGWKGIEQRFKATLKNKEKEEPEAVLPEVTEGDILQNVV